MSAPAEEAIVITFAVKEEMKFVPALPGVRRFITGMGRDNAERAIEVILEQVRPTVVLTCGYAGGLNPSLKTNDVIFNADYGSALDEKLEQAGALRATFFCARRVAITSDEKLKLWRGTGMDAVEMESESIREICQARNIPSATVRVISDSAAEDLPLDFNTLLSPAQKIHYGKLSWALVRSPWKLAELLAFQQKTVEAAKRLGAYLQKLVESGALNNFKPEG